MRSKALLMLIRYVVLPWLQSLVKRTDNTLDDAVVVHLLTVIAALDYAFFGGDKPAEIPEPTNSVETEKAP